MAVECPHCCLRVLIGNDNICPNCKNNITDLTNTNPNKSMIEIELGQELPEICCVCGKEAESYIKIKMSHSNSNKIIGIILKIILLFISPIRFLIHISRSSNNREYSKMKYKMPICLFCKQTEKVQPEYFNFSKYTMLIAVHKEFKAALKNKLLYKKSVTKT